MPGVDWGPSTVRAELALLEAEGYLTHPHTSAGRVPTDSGYRCYVDLLLESGQAPGDTQVELQLSRLRREVDEAMRETTAALAQVTDLVAMATAPQLTATTTIHRVEVLRLQPTRVVVIVIASTGDVARRVFDFESVGRHRPGRVGLQLPERAADRARHRRPDDRHAARRPGARPGRGALRRPPRTRLHRPRTRRRRRPLRRRRGAAPLRSPHRRPAARRRADDRAGAPRRRAADAALLARPSAPSSSGSATRTRSRPCARPASSAPTTVSATATSAPSAWSARGGWTTRPRSPRSASPPVSSPVTSRPSTTTDERRARAPMTAVRHPSHTN